MPCRIAITAILSLTAPCLFASDGSIASGTRAAGTDSQHRQTALSDQDYLGEFHPGMPDGHGGTLSEGEFADRQGRVIQKSMATLASEECPTFIFQNSFDPGYLSRGGGPRAPIEYVTARGYLVRVQHYTITIFDPFGANFVQHWGDPHENLNGKHVKDWGSGKAGWDTNRRTIVLGDGSKVTMTANGPTGVVEFTSIYDGNHNVQIDNPGSMVLHYDTDLADTQAREMAQHDGETALFTTDLHTAVAVYSDIYNENANFEILEQTVPIGATGGCANPGQVNDLFP